MRKREKRDVLFLCQFFYPETVSSATLPFDTAADMAERGVKVGALCGYPKEYTDKCSVSKKETVRGVDIKRVRYLQCSRAGSLGRIINYFSFTFKVLLNLKELRKYKSVIVYSNPPILPIVPLLAKKIYGTKIIFVCYDVYPEIAYSSGSIRKGSMIDKVMQKINRKLYRKSDAVVALTDEMRSFLLKNRDGLVEKKTFTIENWAHEGERVIPCRDAYERFGFDCNSFIVGYFGNLGTCQDISTLLDAALKLKDDPRLGFLIVGHGNKKEKAKEFISQNRLNNVKIYDFLVGEEFKQAVAISNCCVVSLEKGLNGTCAPSKYYSCLLGGHPVIALVEGDSYLAREVENEKVGYHVENGDSDGFCNKLRMMVADITEVEKMSQRARDLYDGRYSIEIAMNKYETVLKTVLQGEEK